MHAITINGAARRRLLRAVFLAACGRGPLVTGADEEFCLKMLGLVDRAEEDAEANKEQADLDERAQYERLRAKFEVDGNR